MLLNGKPAVTFMALATAKLGSFRTALQSLAISSATGIDVDLFIPDAGKSRLPLSFGWDAVLFGAAYFLPLR